MANKEHVEIARAGTKTLNRWREMNSSIQLDLKAADLRGIDLRPERLPGPEFVPARPLETDPSIQVLKHNIRRANLYRADLRQARLENADLTDVDLRAARLDGASMREIAMPRATLGGASLLGVELSWSDLGWSDLTATKMRGSTLVRVDFTGANLRHADLAETELGEAKFQEVVFEGTSLAGARFARTVFAAIDLTEPDFRDATHYSPSSVGADTLELTARALAKDASKTDAVVQFLRSCGLSDEALQFFRERIGTSIQFFSVFISYSTKDEEFASRLYADLQGIGIRCWKWDHDARTGRSLWGEVDSAIRVFDKVVLIASKDSLRSAAVNREIERAIQQEDLRFSSDDVARRDVLFPIRLDDYIFKRWEHERKADVLRKVIADAHGWNKSPKRYREIFNRLVRDLRA
jgi:uncharacterized protein YjbI with pentapeptide repeats